MKFFKALKKFGNNVAEKAKQGYAAALTALGLGIAGIEAKAAPIAAPDMADATGSVTAVFGAILGVAVLIFGFKKVKSLL